MKIYRLDWVEIGQTEGVVSSAWAGSRAAAVTKRAKIEQRLGKHAADVHITQMEVPEGKALLVEWLNANVVVWQDAVE